MMMMMKKSYDPEAKNEKKKSFLFLSFDTSAARFVQA